MQKKTTRRHTGNGMIPVTLNDGRRALIPRSTIGKGDWDIHHGTSADGTQVNSMKTHDIPGTMTVRIKFTDGKEINENSADFEVACAGYLKTKGYNITPPTIGDK